MPESAEAHTDLPFYLRNTCRSQLPINQLNRDRVLRAVETEMAAKGFTKSEVRYVVTTLPDSQSERTIRHRL